MHETLDPLARLIQQGRFLEAAKLAEKAIAHSKSGSERNLAEARLLELAGIALREAGCITQAEAALLQALSIQSSAGKDRPDYARTLGELGLLYEELCQYPSAEKLYRSALAVAEKALPANDPLCIDCLQRLAVLLEILGQFAEAETFQARVRQVLPKNAPASERLARLLSAEAWHAWRLGQLRQAETQTQKALNVFRQCLGEDHPEVGSCEQTLARLCLHTVRIPEAEALAQHALGIRRTALGDKHHQVAASLETLAVIRISQGRLPEAEELANQAVALVQASLGDKHTYYADALCTKAFVCQSRGQIEQAETLIQQAMGIYSALLGEGHLQVAINTRELGELQAQRGQHHEAEEFYQLALNRLSRLGEAGAYEALQTQAVLAQALLASNRPEQALQVARKAVEDARRWHGRYDTPILLANSLDALARVQQSLGQISEAETPSREALKLRQDTLGEHPQTAESLRLLASCRAAVGQVDEALVLQQQAVDLVRKLLGENHPEFVQVLSGLAEYQAHKGDFEQAEQLYLQVANLERERVGEDHPDHAQAIRHLARLYQAMNNLVAAEARYRQVLEILQHALGEHHVDCAVALCDLANLYYQVGDLGNAETLFEEAQEIRQQHLGVQHPHYAQTLHGLALVYQGQGRLDEAANLFEQALSIQEQALGANHFYTLRLRQSMAFFEQARGRFRRAEEQLQLVRQGLLDAAGGVSTLLVEPLAGLARLQGNLGDQLAAEKYWREIAEINRTLQPENVLQCAQDQINLALCLRAQGELTEARTLVIKALAILEQVRGVNNPEVAATIGLLAGLYQATAEEPYLFLEPSTEDSLEDPIREAERLYRDALERTQIALGQNHPALTVVLTELAGLYSSTGQFDEAVAALQQACELAHRTHGEDHQVTVDLLRLLAGLLASLGRRSEAESLYRRRVTILQRLYGQNSVALVPARQMLVDLYRNENRLSEAEVICQQSVEAFRRVRSERSGSGDAVGSVTGTALPPALEQDLSNGPALAMAESNLAAIYLAQGKAHLAEPLLRRALRDVEERVGQDHPAHAMVLTNLAVALAELQRWSSALDILGRLIDRDNRLLPHLLAMPGERNRAALCHPAHENYEALLAIACESLGEKQQATGNLANRVLDAVLQRKRFGIDVLAVPLLLHLERANPHLSADLRRLRVLDRQIAGRLLTGPGMEEKETLTEQLAEWQRQRNALEQQLASKLPVLERRRQLRKVEWSRLVTRLRPGAVLVEFVLYRKRNTASSADLPQQSLARYAEQGVYLAVHRRSGESAAHLVQLGAAQVIDPLIREYRQALQQGNPSKLISAEAVLREVLWSAIEPLIAGSSDVVLSPDGELWHIPLHLLCAAEGRKIRQVVCGRDLLYGADPASGPAVVMGGTRGATASGWIRWVQQILHPWLGRPEETPVADKPKRGPVVERLPEVPGSSTEVERVAFSLGVRPTTGSAATVEALMRHQRPRIVHLSVPAFFLLDRPWQPVQQSPPVTWENPLFYSGLLLPSGEKLTSWDITRLDLMGSIIVLTGGETPFALAGGWSKVSGFLSAFLQAGARAVVCSLWQSSPAARLAFLEEFYRALGRGQDASEAVRLAQDALKQSKRPPKEWAGWICVTDGGRGKSHHNW